MRDVGGDGGDNSIALGAAWGGLLTQRLCVDGGDDISILLVDAWGGISSSDVGDDTIGEPGDDSIGRRQHRAH